jgi:hypothetical protein
MSKPLIAAAVSLLVALPSLARAHCDTLDGPVVQTARTALDTGTLNPVLAWVRPQDEAEVKAAFARARAVRKASPEARALADTWFFETVVRVHRAGEGAPYTGLKPAGLKIGPAVLAADQAIDTGSAEPVEKLLADTVRTGVRERFARLKAQKRPAEDVAAGRLWVEAYVPFVHYVEGVHDLAAGGASAHAAPAAGKHDHGEPAPSHDHGQPAPAASHDHGQHK